MEGKYLSFPGVLLGPETQTAESIRQGYKKRQHSPRGEGILSLYKMVEEEKPAYVDAQ